MGCLPRSAWFLVTESHSLTRPRIQLSLGEQMKRVEKSYLHRTFIQNVKINIEFQRKFHSDEIPPALNRNAGVKYGVFIPEGEMRRHHTISEEWEKDSYLKRNHFFKNLGDPRQKHKHRTQEMEKNKPPQVTLLEIRNKKEKDKHGVPPTKRFVFGNRVT